MRSLQLNHKLFPVVLTAVFLVFGIIGISHHEMWRDELQAWLIARDSLSLFDLIENMQYEGHPALWHILLYIITRLTNNPIAMQYLHLTIGVSCVFLVAKYSPFTAIQKIFISFGYFSLYEYLVISRNYSIGVLITFLACSLYIHRFQKPLTFLIILGLLANTTIYGWIIAISFAIMFALEIALEGKMSMRLSEKSEIYHQYKLVLGTVFYISATIASFLIVLPPKDRYLGVGGLDLGSDFSHILNSISAIWRGYVPLSQISLNFWNTNFIVDKIDSDSINYLNHVLVSILVICIVVFVATKLFKISRNAFIIYSIGTGLLFLFTYGKFLGELRHHGYFYIVLLASIWIAMTEEKERKKLEKSELAYLLFTIFLFIQFISSLWPYYIDLRAPFTMNQVAAQYISQYMQSHQQNDFMIAGYRSPPISSFSALLNTSIYYPQIGDYGSFVVWTKQSRQEMTARQIVNNIVQEAKQQKKDCILITDEELVDLPNFSDGKRNRDITQLTSFTDSIVESEQFYIYRILITNS